MHYNNLMSFRGRQSQAVSSLTRELFPKARNDMPFIMTIHQITFGTQTIEYQLERMPRKTLAISVHPDLSILVKAPVDTSLEEINERVTKRAKWILNQKRRFEIFLPDVPPRKYVSGESHRFLGRQYRLKVIEIASNEEEQIKLTRQFLEVYTSDRSPSHVRELVEIWYREQANSVFHERLTACYSRLSRENVLYPKITIRKMQSSWGRCSAKGTISLNIKLIQVPKEYIDYVLIHELCHLKYLHHESEFYYLLSRIMPDWKRKKEKLDRFDFG
jgi:predicted metal-dependent hydrolase